MSEEKKIKKFTATEIEKYRKGLLSPRERHDIEKAALDDPFLAEAIEGYVTAGIEAGADLAELKSRLASRIEAGRMVAPIGKGSRRFYFLRVAAILVLIAGAGWLVYQFSINRSHTEIAESKPGDQRPISQDSISDQDQKTPSATTKNNTVFQPAETSSRKNTNPIVSRPEATTHREKEAERTLHPVTDSQANLATGPVTSAATGAGEKRELAGLAGKAEDKEKKNAEKTQPKDRDYTAKTSDDLKVNKAAVPAARGEEKQPMARQQMNIFRGRVTDPSNSGVPFANVTNVQDNAGTYTDANGNFILTSTDSVLNVQIRSVGFENNNAALRNDVATNRIVLQEDRKGLNEIVISNAKPDPSRSFRSNVTLDEPEPADGWEKYNSYVANNLEVPTEFEPRRSQSNDVQVSFEVNKDGEPVKFRVEKSLCAACDKEAIRLIKEGPRWKNNAKRKGRTTVTISF